MNQIEKKEKLNIKVEYGIAVFGLRPSTIRQGITQIVKYLYFYHRSGRRSAFDIPKPFHKLIYAKMKGKFARVEFTLATYEHEEPRMKFTKIYTIAFRHKSDNFRRSIGREIVTGRIKRYLKDKYESYKGFHFEDDYGRPIWKWEKPDFIHTEPFIPSKSD